MNIATSSILKVNNLVENRFILARVLDQTLAIPAHWVVEVLRVDRKKILNLPFYQDLMLGVIHHGGRVLPILSAQLLLGEGSANVREIVTVVRLGSLAGDIVEVGLVVDQVVRSAMQFELPVDMLIFDPKIMRLDLWQPST